jgi:hypothetical protein
LWGLTFFVVGLILFAKQTRSNQGAAANVRPAQPAQSPNET